TAYGTNAVYARLVLAATGSAYAAEDQEIRAWMEDVPADAFADARVKNLRALGPGAFIVGLPRHDSFTAVALGLLRRGASFRDIAGNNVIVLTTLGPRDTPRALPSAAAIVFDERLLTNPTVTRLAVRAPVQALGPIVAALEQVRHALALGKRKLADAPHPVGERLGLARADLVGGQSLPAAHRHLAQIGHERGRQPVRRADDLAAAPRAPEVARVERGDRCAGEPARLRDALRLAARGQRHVEVADEPPRVGVRHLAVAQQIDQDRACAHAETVSSAASSASSTPAPRTSPVTPPSRPARKTPRPSALAVPTARATTPGQPRTATATTRAMASDAGAAARSSPAEKTAPCPPARAAGNSRPSSAGVARAMAGAATRVRQRVPGGSSLTAASSSIRKRMRPMAPNVPMRLSLMIASRVAGSRPDNPSRQSARPSRCRPPVRSFHTVTVSSAASSGGKTRPVPASTAARTSPSAAPTTGNQGAARPRSSRPAWQRRDMGRIVR